ncbi:MAG: hypothetical protein ACJ764_12520 [Solirubrobacteraceae bacterium]
MSVLNPGGTGRRTALATATVLSAVALAACGGSSTPTASQSGKAPINGHLNTARVALAIQQSILSERHVHAKVVCPPNVPQEKGLSFTCVATTYTTKGHHPIHTLFTVFQKDSNGNVYYQSPK